MARHLIKQQEFEALVEAISRGETSVAVWLVAYIVFQYAMIARVDDTAKFCRPDLKTFRAYPKYGLLGKL